MTRARTGWASAAVAAVLVLAACGHPASEQSKTVSSVPLKGTILGTGDRFGQSLAEYTLPDFRQQDLKVVEQQSGIGYGFDYLGAYWADAAHAVTFHSTGDHSQVVEAAAGADPRQVGPPLTFVSSFDVRGKTVVAATCRALPGKVFVLNRDRPNAWREVGQSCLAVLSPDGDRVAFVRHDTEVWTRPLPSGSASRLFDVTDVPDVRRAHLGRPVINQLRWGDGGIVVAVSRERDTGGFGLGRSLVVARDNEGAIRMVPLQPQELVLPNRPWQPGGNLLAFINRPFSGGALVRLFDPASGKVWVVATDAQYFGNALWAPDGRAIAASTSGNAMLFVDTKGNWIKRIGTGGVGLLDWGAG